MAPYLDLFPQLDIVGSVLHCPKWNWAEQD